MTIARVQGNFRGSTVLNAIAIAMTNPPTNGNIIIACVAVNRNTGASETCVSIVQVGVTWTRVAVRDYGAGGAESSIWVGEVGAGANANLTVNLNQNTVVGTIADVCEYSGVYGSHDKEASTFHNSGAGVHDMQTGTTDMTTLANELWIGMILKFNFAGVAANHVGPTYGFALLDGANEGLGGVNIGLAYLEKIVTQQGFAISGTSATDNNYYNGLIATFFGKPATGVTLAVERMEEQQTTAVVSNNVGSRVRVKHRSTRLIPIVVG